MMKLSTCLYSYIQTLMMPLAIYWSPICNRNSGTYVRSRVKDVFTNNISFRMIQGMLSTSIIVSKVESLPTPFFAARRMHLAIRRVAMSPRQQPRRSRPPLLPTQRVIDASSAVAAARAVATRAAPSVAASPSPLPRCQEPTRRRRVARRRLPQRPGRASMPRPAMLKAGYYFFEPRAIA